MQDISNAIIPILIKYNVKKASLFGSYARGNNNEKSDIDILIEPPEKMGISVVRLKRELEQVLNKKVDLVSFNGINRYLKDSILVNQKIIL
ncbi:MAG: nucleotidyltransferase family protein [Candidatus Roizmanbacteria bacterium]|nr:nucleotidyltransferase family protein [Candidatus Roizmanbacteria bacterium]